VFQNLRKRSFVDYTTNLKKLDKDKSGGLSPDEFMEIPELKMNPLVERVIDIFDVNKDNVISFEEFITGVSVFCVQGAKDEKLKFAFKVYDIDCDGFISNGELFRVLKMMVGNNLTDIQLQQIVDKTIIDADEDKDGKISFEEFKKIVEGTDIDSKMTITL